MEKRVGIVYSVEAKDTIRELSNVELAIDKVNQQVKEAKKTADGDTYKKLREEQLKLRGEANELRKTLRQQQKDFRDAKFPPDSLIGLRRQYRLLSREIDQISTSDPKFKEKAREAAQLSNRINELSKSTGNFRNNIGRYEESIVSAIGSTGDLISGNLTGLVSGLGIGGALGALLSIGTEGVQAVADLANEIREVRQQVRLLTGETGSAGDEIAARAIAIADAFGKDLNEVLLASNSLTKQLTGDFGTSFDLIEKGLLSGADANGELFDSLKEYPAFFRELGLSGEQFISVISQGVEEGVFSDKAPDLLKEFNLRVRELPQTTRDAFDAIGIDSKKIGKLIEEEGLASAFQVVQSRLGELREDSPEVGQALADIFGGAGEDAGIQFIKTLDLSQEGLEKMIDRTDNLTQRQLILLEVNQDYARSQLQLSQALDATGNTFVGLGTRIKTALIDTLVNLIDNFTALSRTVRNFLDGNFEVVNYMDVVAERTGKAAIEADTLSESFDDAGDSSDTLSDKLSDLEKSATKASETGITRLKTELSGLQKSLEAAASPEAFARITEEIDTLQAKIDETRAKNQRFVDGIRGVDTVFSALPSISEEGTPEERVRELIETLGLEKTAKLENEKETQRLLTEIQDEATKEVLKKRRERFDEALDQEREFAEMSSEIIGSSVEATSEIFGQFLTDQEITFKDFLKDLIVLAIDFIERQILLSIAQAQAASLASPESVATFGAAGIAKGALLAGLIKGVFAGIKAQVQNFDIGGQVLPSGPIKERPNIRPSKPGGDNVLATVRTGEMILNKGQQFNLERMVGPNIWKAIGIPGFQDGGQVPISPISNPILLNPNSIISSEGQAAKISEESFQIGAGIIADRVSAQVSVSVQQAVADGFEEAVRRSERRQNLKRNISK